MSKYVLGIDVGTTSVKVVLVSSEGFIVDEASENHDLLSPHPNWAEENATIWWSNIVKAVSTIAKKNPDKMKDIQCIGCSGMVPAIVLLDQEGNPLRNTIQQNDSRAINQIERITKTLDQKVLFEKTGGTTNQQHILPRLLWVKENEPDVWEKVVTVMGSYDYVVYKLTGVKSLEMNWAVESGSFDIHTQKWITEDLEKFDIDPSILPSVNPSIDIVGSTLAFTEELMGLPAGIPVIAGSADHVASTLAAGIVEKGDLLIKFGGAGDILYCVDEIVTSPKLFFDYHIVPGNYLLNGCMAASGSLVKWFVKDIIHSESPTVFKELDLEAAKVPPASDGLVILPYFLGEKTPIFDPTARGVLFGLTLSHTKAHIFRAILEAVIYGFRHHIEVIKEMGYQPKRIMATNGGAKSKFWCQIAADVLGETICSFPSHPGSALGVAFLAGKKVGVFQQWDEIHKFLTDYRIYEPNPEAVSIYNKSYKIYRDLYQELRTSFDDVQKLYTT
ncbi:MAG: FGGY-family carbohydrate kinase [Clostridiales bacterium]|nr:FGGY-family carbohydrate kinase [Clostridiales bacterium]